MAEMLGLSEGWKLGFEEIEGFSDSCKLGLVEVLGLSEGWELGSVEVEGSSLG